MMMGAKEHHEQSVDKESAGKQNDEDPSNCGTAIASFQSSGRDHEQTGHDQSRNTPNQLHEKITEASAQIFPPKLKRGGNG